MRLRAAAFAALLITSLPAGCTAAAAGWSDLRSDALVPIAGRDLNCDGSYEKVDDPQFYDLTGDHLDDAFVEVRCKPGNLPAQLEMFDGRYSPTGHAPVVIVRNSEQIMLDGCLLFGHNYVVVTGTKAGVPWQRAWKWEKGALVPDAAVSGRCRPA